MKRFSANLTTMFSELPFRARFEAARRSGFSAVEFQYAYDHAHRDLAALLDDNGLSLVLINAPLGPEPQNRGLACLPGRRAAFRTSVETALDYAVALGCPLIHVLSGIPSPDHSRSASLAQCAENLAWAAERGGQAGVGIVLEALNPFDVPGYLLKTQADAAAMIRAVGSERCGLLFDFYHCMRSEGDVVRLFKEHLSMIVHVQIADAPGRNEPGSGEIDWEPVFQALDSSRYRGFIGCEYRPLGETAAGLGWIEKYCRAPAPMRQDDERASI